ncbi:unnamed protein product [Prunus armeniaca]
MATFSLLEVLLERSGVSSAGEKVRTFDKGSSRQASNIGVVPAEGSLMLKSAMSGKFDRVTVKIRQSGASGGVCYYGRVSFFRRGEGVSALVLVVLRLDMLG